MIDTISSIIHLINPENHSFLSGEKVKIIDGAFTGFDAIIQDDNTSKSSIDIIVKVAGREIPVELRKDQIEKIV